MDKTMRHSIKVLLLTLTGVLLSFTAQGQSEDNELITSKYVLGPATIANDQQLKICMTDVAGLTGATKRSTRSDESTQIHTQIKIFDSRDTTKPLAAVDGNDFLIWQRQYGTCVNVAVGDVNGDGIDQIGEPHAIIAILISIREGDAPFQLVASAQVFEKEQQNAADDHTEIIAFSHEVISPPDAN